MPFDNTNRFVLFTNKDKKNPKGPDYSGTVNIGGTEYKLAGWIQQGRMGKFVSGRVEEIDVNGFIPQKQEPPKEDEDEIDRIPF